MGRIIGTTGQTQALKEFSVGLSFVARAIELSADEEGYLVDAGRALLHSVQQQLPRHHHETPFETVYINLAKRDDRRVHIEGELYRAGLTASRLVASTGADAMDSVVARTWDSNLNATFDAKTIGHPCVALSPGERGCAASHHKLWEICAARPEAACPLLILEDDAVLAAGFSAQLSKLIGTIEATWPDPASRNIILYLVADVAKWRGQTMEIEPGLGVRECAYQWRTLPPPPLAARVSAAYTRPRPRPAL